MKAITIDRHSVHIWWIPLLPADTAENTDILCPKEVQRAAAIPNPAVRRSFCQSRSAMREIIARYLGVGAKELAIRVDAFGKPQLAPDHYALDIRFNISHSGALAVLAVTLGSDVGVDIEPKHRRVKVDALSRRYFADSTLQQLTQLPEDQRQPAFLKLWTQYEAYRKAKGDGLRGNEPRLPLAPDRALPNNFKDLPPGHAPGTSSAAAGGAWQVASLEEHSDYLGSVAIENCNGVKTIVYHYFRP